MATYMSSSMHLRAPRGTPAERALEFKAEQRRLKDAAAKRRVAAAERDSRAVSLRPGG